MSENLKVNANSTILEFKRKHNLLVDVVPQKDSDGNYNIFEHIVDSHGHKRFDGGNIIMSERTGVTYSFNKWSLSGTHLLIVVQLSVTNGTLFSTGYFGEIRLPEWILDKIQVVFGTNRVIRTSQVFYADDESQQTATIRLLKDEENACLRIACGTDLTLTADRNTRIAFDLLIDDEEPQEQGE